MHCVAPNKLQRDAAELFRDKSCPGQAMLRHAAMTACMLAHGCLTNAPQHVTSLACVLLEDHTYMFTRGSQSQGTVHHNSQERSSKSSNTVHRRKWPGRQAAVNVLMGLYCYCSQTAIHNIHACSDYSHGISSRHPDRL